MAQRTTAERCLPTDTKEPARDPSSTTAMRPTQSVPPSPPDAGAARVAARDPKHGVWALMLSALGVVFGDIGTSPLYTLKACIEGVTHGERAIAPDEVLELLSLIVWALTLVVTIKYLVFVLRSHNKGEGGIFALLALLPRNTSTAQGIGRLTPVAVLVVIGAALLYGDGVITPAISVLSAIEGITVARPGLHGFVVPATIVLLVLLFAVQSRGTQTIGRFFGPVMLLWFATLAALGGYHIVQAPMVLRALLPTYALGFFAQHGLASIFILGAVVLAVTGAEALYADMGHFGPSPIRRGWMLIVMPSLVLSYLGQGAMVLQSPMAALNPFFSMVKPGVATFALVALSSAATVIASQALISGCFSLTRQAMQLGFFPRVTVRHTAVEHEGQVYLPAVNLALAVVSCILVLTFRESAKLAAAYGIAVTGTMTITSFVYFVVLTRRHSWPMWKALPVLLFFLSFDVPFLVANVVKIPDGGWVPLALACIVVFVMLVWHEGRRLQADLSVWRESGFHGAWARVQSRLAARVPGTAIVMGSSEHGLPPMLVHHVERTRSLHERVVLLTVFTSGAPFVQSEGRVEVVDVAEQLQRVRISFGFMEVPDVPLALAQAVERGVLALELTDVTFFLGRERILAGSAGRMHRVFEAPYAFLERNCVHADRHFHIPPALVVEVGTQIDL